MKLTDKQSIRREAIAKTGRSLREQVQKSGGKDPGAAAAENRVRQAIARKERKE